MEYVCRRIGGGYNIRYRKMFGEYMVYANDKPVLLVCDNCVFVKKLPELENLMSGAECGVPYVGAKEHYILDADDEVLMREAVSILEKITPLPKKRK